MDEQKYGGGWSDEKLQVLHDYLVPYLRIFHKNTGAQFLNPIYVDAFAGCGTRTPREDNDAIADLFDSDEDRSEAEEFAKSSPRVALGLEQAFNRYLFIESNAKYANQLIKLLETEFPGRRQICDVHIADANEFLPDWCRGLRHSERAVMFLDPYGTEVNWKTIQAIGQTQKIDLWVLLPCSGILRMLPKNKLPRASWTLRLNEFLGTDRWQEEWYSSIEQDDLFGGDDKLERRFTASDLARWITKRLAEEFTQVIANPLILRNSKGSPLFMLTFAAGNPKGASTACRIANGIICAQANKR